MNPVVASPWPSALRFLAEGLSADRALRLAIDGSSCRKAIAVGGGLDGLNVGFHKILLPLTSAVENVAELLRKTTDLDGKNTLLSC